LVPAVISPAPRDSELFFLILEWSFIFQCFGFVYIILCCIVLYYILLHVTLCYVMLCYVMLCYVMLCYVMLCLLCYAV